MPITVVTRSKMARMKPKSWCSPGQIVALMLAGWINRHQQAVIAYQKEEIRVLREMLGCKGLRLQCEAATLFIGESQTLATKHLAQHLDLFFLVRDDRLLVSVDPSRKHQHHKLPRRAPRFRFHGCHFTPDDSRQRCCGAPSKCWNPLSIRRFTFGTLRVAGGPPRDG